MATHIPRMEIFMLLRTLTFPGLAAVLILTLLQSGCGMADRATSESADDDADLLDGLFGDIDLSEQPLPDGAEHANSGLSLSRETGGADQQLKLRLSTGDQFPLTKIVEQTLVQKSAQHPADVRTKLELHMVVQVQTVNPNAIFLNVNYTRVIYEHDLNGESLVFDSGNPNASVPVSILPYAGMVGNGFSFWLGQDNSVREIVGYKEFLQRCVRDVPHGQRTGILNGISARLGADGVANFIDDTIGILPYNANVDAVDAATVQVGDMWTREREIAEPVPVTLTSTCRLLSLSEQTAEIDITGRISAPQSEPGSTGIRVKEGRCSGACVIDRATGLPLKLDRSQYLTMMVPTAGGEIVEQQKRVQTTIRTGRTASTVPVAQRTGNHSMPGNIRLTSGQTQSQGGHRPTSTTDPVAPTQPQASGGRVLSSTVQAVYPD